MREQEINEGLGELADRAERDHEVQMARSELYKLAKYAIKLHDILKGVSEAEGLEGWVQSKITKSADMISSVYHHMDYEEASEPMEPDALNPVKEAKDTHCSDKCCGADVKAEDCTCKPSCPHCNCNAVNETLSPEDKKLVDKMYNKDGTLTAIGKKVMDHGKKDKKPAVKEAKKKMVKDPKTGKMVPDYAADGKGKNDLKKESLQNKLAAKLSEATQTCNECGKTMLTATEKKELANLPEGKRHGNSKIYKKCWKGCRKVAGVPRGEPGSCKCD